MQLANAVLLVARTGRRTLALNDQRSVLLFVGLAIREDHDVDPRFSGSKADREFNGNVLSEVPVLLDERLGDFLPDVLLKGLSTLALTVDVVEQAPLLDD
jgi:hypothetical protein